MSDQHVVCPKCGHRFQLTKALTMQIEADLHAKIQRKVQSDHRKEVEEERRKIEKQYDRREQLNRRTQEDLKKKLREATRKLEQGSEQKQGEVAELQLQQVLTDAFHDDEIRSVPKGKYGADIVHRVFSSTHHHCGTILWESKTHKNWDKKWLDKLKSDQRREKADLAAIVCASFPPNLPPPLGQMAGIWVTDFSCAIGLAMALRTILIDVQRNRLTQERKPEKAQILYNYLMSSEFRQRVEAIVEAFHAMQDDLSKEMQATQCQQRLKLHTFTG